MDVLDGGFWSLNILFGIPFGYTGAFLFCGASFSTLVFLLYTTLLGGFLHSSGGGSHAFMKPLELHY